MFKTYAWVTIIIFVCCSIAEAQITVDTFLSDLTSPLGLQAPPDGTDRLFVAERRARIQIIDDVFGTPNLRSTPFIDLRIQGRTLLGLAFHPNYATNGLFYVHYTDTLPKDSTQINIPSLVFLLIPIWRTR